MNLPALSLLNLVLLVARVYACGDHSHVHPRRGQGNGAGQHLTPPTRPLEWGDINFIHTTDSHGWLLGHQKTSFPEPNYSADLGEFASFVTHMKETADEKGVDLLLVDSGDLHDGTGLSDGFPPGGVDAHDSNQFMKLLPYDAMAIGNHELYIYANTLDMHQNFAPALKGRYLSSNVNITVTGHDGKPLDVPVGERFAKFQTKHGRQITALGVLFDFTDNDKNTTVQPVADMVNEQWFKDAIQEEPDLFLLVGHMPVSRDNWPLVFNAVRAVHKTTPIVILGGHTHIRDCVQLDDRSMSLESGRYMETVGWMSAKLDRRNTKDPIQFHRRYLDTNRVTYEFHTKKNDRQFDTSLGKKVTDGLQALATRFDLNSVFGTAPEDYLLLTAPYPANNSALTLFIKAAVPTALQSNRTGSGPAMFMTNSGSLRFDVYEGPFTRNDQYTVSPFTDSFRFISNITLADAVAAFNALNNPSSSARRQETELTQHYDVVKGYGKGNVDEIFKDWLKKMEQKVDLERRGMNNLTLGYVTQDSCPGVGDDTLHTPLTIFDSPEFISSDPPTGNNITNDTLIDFVFVDFVQDDVLAILNSMHPDKNLTADDTQLYSDILSNAVLGVFAQEAWN
jgi:2',3'-cyclic-nucleotide 2'-phosphodiesterase (5'-nucleotidase family)